MCIRDSNKVVPDAYPYFLATDWAPPYRATRIVQMIEAKACLLYTSDAADERSSVDLGGRRIIKKKTTSV